MVKIAPEIISPGTALLRARKRAAMGDANRIERLYLNPVARGVPGVDVHSVITAARVNLTMQGASIVTVTLEDPEWRIEESGLLDVRDDGRMDAIDVTLDTLAFRLAKASRQSPESLQLTFEDLVIAHLRQHTKPRSWSRGSVTRAQAVQAMVREVKAVMIGFYSPEKSRKQPTATPDYPDTAPARGETGFDKGVKLKIRGNTADAAQMREMATALGVADQENAGPRATLAMVVAGIGESEFRAIPNRAGSPYAGVFQAHPKNIPMKDTAQQARYFLKGGKGFQRGGAIALARENPGMSVGTIAYLVEGSRANFASDHAAEHHYGQHRAEAKKIIAAYNSGADSGEDETLYAKSFHFTRGLPGKRENSWEAATRLAEEVNWRFYAAGGATAFISDDFLITNPAGLVIDDPNGPGVLDRPTYDWDHGKLAGSVELRVVADRWSVWPGEVVALLGEKWGPLTGRWLVLDVDQNLLDPSDCTVTLTKPLAARKEPAAEIAATTTTTTSATPDKITTSGGAEGIVDQAFELAKPHGGDIFVVSAYRPGDTVAGGGPSDHSENNADRAARDIAVRGVDAIKGPPSAKLDQAVIDIGRAFRRNYTLGEPIIDTFPWRGFRVQIIWRTPAYGGHMGHIHIGARRA